MNTDNIDDYAEGLTLSKGISLITFQTPELIRHLKNMKMPTYLSAIVDLESVDKQMSQEGKDLRKYNKWTLLATLKHHKIVPENFRLTISNVRECLEYAVSLYNKLMEKDVEESLRFKNIERDITNIIFHRQYEGIKIVHSSARKRCGELDREIYRTKNTLQIKYRIFDPDSADCQKNYLLLKNMRLIKSPLFTFKAWRNEDEVSRLWYEMLRNQKDLDSLLFMLSHWGGSDHAYPKYIGFGTITSRIIMRDPSFQNLRKSNRSFIEAESGHKLLYVDYSQFEAGILASLSKDSRLIELYNKDIYGDLAEKILGDVTKRSDAKVIFYRFMYGDTTLKANIINYFHQFPDLQAYRTQIDTEIEIFGRIGTESGNFRLKAEDGVGWALSHVIQATASLIYKKAVTKVFKEVPEAQLLIPMHDGTLYQINIVHYDRVKAKVEEIYIKEFKQACPRLNGKINLNDIFD